MKRIFTIAAALLMTASVWAQAPQKMSYQAVVRNATNDLVTSTTVGVKISILQGSSSGTEEYVETQTAMTNDNGLVSLKIGDGNVVSGDISTIDWANGPYYIKTETDPTGGTSYTISGTTELLSVPYALHAETTGESSPWTENGSDIYYDDGDVSIGNGDLEVDGLVRTNANDANLIGYYRFGTTDARLYYYEAIDMMYIKGTSEFQVNANTILNDSAKVNGLLEVSENILADGEVIANANGSNTSSYFRFNNLGGPYMYYSTAFQDVSIVNALAGFRVSGDLNATGVKNFKIDHPADPENKYLYHAAIESDVPYNKYSGNITTDANGEAVVELPEYVQLVNKDFRYNLTVIGTFAQAIIGEEVSDNKFIIRTNQPNVKVSWELTGVRNDPYMKQNPYEAEVDKKEGEIGRYLSPELYNQPKEKGQDYQDPKEVEKESIRTDSNEGETLSEDENDILDKKVKQ
ncbi:MAG TPA: hypothetical protein VKY37_13455 [Brumimicrobium sp.]|nr:hypothetical protein [Brumimicrobium sp.]